MKKKITILTFMLITALIELSIYFIIKNNKPIITFSNDLKVEINEEVKILDFITEINKGEIITENKRVDTTKLGSQLIHQRMLTLHLHLTIQLKLLRTLKEPSELRRIRMAMRIIL